MKLLCHRGIWRTEVNKNSLAALGKAMELGLGLETDIRDLDGELVISHDVPTRADYVTLDAFLHMYQQLPQVGLLALNIKSDGLQTLLKSKLMHYQVSNYFVFDMSVPDTLGYWRMAMPFAARLSEFEESGALLDAATHVWLDAFEDDNWYAPELIASLLAKGKTVAVVSPELHKRLHQHTWDRLKSIPTQGRLYLCTDLVAEAQEAFDVEPH